MKTLRLLLLGLLTPLLCGVSFAFDLTADEINYLNNNALNQGSFSNVPYYDLYDNGSTSSDILDLCVIFSGLTFTNSNNPYYEIIGSATAVPPSQSYFNNGFATYPYFLFCRGLVDARYLVLRSSSNANYATNFNVNKFWVLSADKITNGYLGFDVQGLLDNYNNCQTDLNTCDTITSQCLEDKSILSGQLSTCNSDKESLTNYNEALSSQLNECLNNQGTGSNLSGLILNNNSLFRYLDDSLLSLPINNNLFLPLGYQGALDSGNVLYIKSIDEVEPENYYITPEDKVSIIDILSYIFVFFLGIGIIFSLIKLFKKIFTH